MTRSRWRSAFRSSPGSRLRALGCALLLLGVGAFALAPTALNASARDTTTVEKRWIFLHDRPTNRPPAAGTVAERPVAPAYLDRLRALGVRPLVRSRWFHAVTARLSPDAWTDVAALPFVRATRPVGSLTLSAVSTAPHDGLSPSAVGAAAGPLSRINALAPLSRGLNGHGVQVGFLDAHFSGLRHPAFAHLRANDQLGGMRSFPEDPQGGNHGAGVVSVAAGYEPGTLVGPAYGARIWGATTEFTQFERNVEEDHFVAGLEWLTRHGVDVVNVSIGYTRFDEGQRSYAPEDLDGDTAITTRAVDRAARRGVTMVVSAGNSGCDDPDACWFYVNTPADADSAIAVGAIAADSSVAPFSARGPTADGRRKPDVVVQGQNVPAAWEQSRYAEVSGTSFASPQVTGVVAQMLQVNPSLTPIQVRQVLRHTASQAHVPDTTRGWGIVNADMAIRTAEWRARRSPPPSLRVSAPDRNADASSVMLPVSAPAHTSTLQARLTTPSGQRVLRTSQSAHPGPNRLALDMEAVPPGLYRYVVTTDTGDRVTGRVTISP